MEVRDAIARSISGVDRRLVRIQFNQERERPLRVIGFDLQLTGPTTQSDLPHFRALMLVYAQGSGKTYSVLGVAATDDGSPNAAVTSRGRTVRGKFWYDNPAKVVVSSEGVWPEPFEHITGRGGYHPLGVSDQPTLSDLDENYFGFFVNRSLAERIANIRIIGNDWQLWSSPRSKLRFDAPNQETPWSWTLSNEESADPWVRMMSDSGVFHFDDYVPTRLFDDDVPSSG